MMDDLIKANEINDEEIWQALGGYLHFNVMFGGGGSTSMRNFRNSARIKKYFITTSFNKLKKYIKKYKETEKI
jgi:hypothetical protein